MPGPRRRAAARPARRNPTPPAAPAPGDRRPPRRVEQRRPAGPARRPAARRRPGSRPSAGRRRAAAPRRPEQRVVDVAGHDELGARPAAGRSPDRSTVGQPVERARHRAPARRPSRVEEPRAQRLQHAGAAVGAGAAADAEHDLGCSPGRARRGSARRCRNCWPPTAPGRPPAAAPARTRAASSTTADVVPDRERRRHRLAGRARTTVTGTRSKPAATAASSVPSPPSATGSTRTTSPGARPAARRRRPRRPRPRSASP